MLSKGAVVLVVDFLLEKCNLPRARHVNRSQHQHLDERLVASFQCAKKVLCSETSRAVADQVHLEHNTRLHVEQGKVIVRMKDVQIRRRMGRPDHGMLCAVSLRSNLMTLRIISLTTRVVNNFHRGGAVDRTLATTKRRRNVQEKLTRTTTTRK